MSLATRCPACGTVFRVVQDQLRVSEGWVRCGHCQEVFNALEGLFELGPETPAVSSTTSATTSPPVAGTAPLPPPDTAEAAAVTAPLPVQHTELDLSDPGDEALAAAAPPEAPPADDPSPAADLAPPGHARPAQPLPAPALPSFASPPATAFDTPISVSGLLARPDATVPEVAPPADEPVPWPSAEVQPDLLGDGDNGGDVFGPGGTPASPPAEAGAEGTEEATASDPLPFDADDDPAPNLTHDEAIEMPASRLFDEDEASASHSATDDGNGPASLPPPQREWQRKRPRRPRPPGGEAEPDASIASAAGSPHHRPAFLRQADRDALWQRPSVRVALGVTCSLLGALLLGQVLLQFRDGIAARWPGMQPALAQACAWTGCSVDAPRALERISLDGSKLTSVEGETNAAAGGPKLLRFVAELHNAARHRVQAPALELSFTDPLGQVVARRVLLPAELGLGEPTLAAESPWHVDARLDVGELRVAGFSVEIFYP